MSTPPPQWLSQFSENICTALYAVERMPPIGCHVAQVRDVWEVSLFVSETEIVGGRFDGERISCLFLVDILELLHQFDVVESASWQPHQINEHDELRGHISVTGYHQGHHVWLRILSETPERFGPGQVANLRQQRILDTWHA